MTYSDDFARPQQEGFVPRSDMDEEDEEQPDEIDELTEVSEEDIMGEPIVDESTDMSDLLEVSDDDIMGTSKKRKKPKIRRTTKPYYTPPPQLGGMRY